MRFTLQRAIVALVAVVVLAYAVLVEVALFAGVVSAGVLLLTHSVLERGEAERAFVVGAVGTVIAAAFWTARLELIVPAVVSGSLVYLGWGATRGQRIAT